MPRKRKDTSAVLLFELGCDCINNMLRPYDCEHHYIIQKNGKYIPARMEDRVHTSAQTKGVGKFKQEKPYNWTSISIAIEGGNPNNDQLKCLFLLCVDFYRRLNLKSLNCIFDINEIKGKKSKLDMNIIRNFLTKSLNEWKLR